MKSLIFAGTILSLFLFQRETYAQAALYSLPGFNDGFFYGFDAGNGVQVGYGFGAGVAFTPNQLMSSVQGPYTEPLYLGVLAPATSEPEYTWVQPVKHPMKKVKQHAQVKKVK